MKTILSYVLFEQTGRKFDRSGHDPFDKKPNRYWLNIPFILAINKYVLKNSITRIYMPKNIESHPLFPLIKEFSENLDNFEIELIDKQYSLTEPSIWRTKALWEDNVNFVFFKDIDSIITRKEVQSMLFFMNSGFLMHNIRSIRQHNGEGTSLMAGLSGYNIPKLKEELPMPPSFENYLKFYENTIGNPAWGCDQETLINFFIRTRTIRTTKKIMDTYIQGKGSRLGRVLPNRHHPVTSYNESMFSKINIPGVDNNIISLLDTISNWAGQPVNVSGPKTYHILKKIPDKQAAIIFNILNKSTIYKKLFLLN